MRILALALFSFFMSGMVFASEGVRAGPLSKTAVLVRPRTVHTNDVLRPTPPKPGVYRAAPYSMLVIVPRAGIDDAAVIRPKHFGSRMPVIVPDLKLIPIKRP